MSRDRSKKLLDRIETTLKRDLPLTAGSQGRQMKVIVKLFGTLSTRIPEYDAARGMEVNLPKGATVERLLKHLGFSPTEAGLAIINGEPQRDDSVLQEGVEVYLFNLALGG
jgi:sulfur carrier protein ThiS